MQHKPEIDLDRLALDVAAAWGIRVTEIAFRPFGADPDAAAWRVAASGGPPLFLKTKFGAFDPAVLAVPRFLRDAGIAEVLAPIETRDGALSVTASGTTLILYPFVDGRNGFEGALSPKDWTSFGATMRRIHDTPLPAGLVSRVDSEQFCPRWRDSVSRFMADPPNLGGDDIASDLAALLAAKRDDIELFVRRAARLAEALPAKPGRFVLCHSDIHAGNLLVGSDVDLHIVDWDSPRLAPKERDLMFIGGGVGGVWNEPEQEAAFYRGYGAAEIDAAALAYYRYERIVEDIAVTCEQVFLGDGENRAESLGQLAAQWRPGDVVAIAHATYAAFCRRPV